MTQTEQDPTAAAVERLRSFTQGGKGNRPDYGGFISSADATRIIARLDQLARRRPWWRFWP